MVGPDLGVGFGDLLPYSPGWKSFNHFTFLSVSFLSGIVCERGADRSVPKV